MHLKAGALGIARYFTDSLSGSGVLEGARLAAKDLAEEIDVWGVLEVWEREDEDREDPARFGGSLDIGKY